MTTPKAISQHEKTRRRIKLELLNRNRSIASVARKIGRSRTAVSMAINRGVYADTLKKTLMELQLK